jgi:nucleoside-diphosphate-sugar epimerase
MTKYLVIGGGGFIGYYVSQTLAAQGHEVEILDVFDPYGSMNRIDYNYLIEQRLKGHNFKIYPTDINDRPGVFKTFERSKPDVIIHLAAYPRAVLVERYPERGVNTLTIGLKNVLDAAAVHEVKHITYASSSMVYGDFGDQAPTEYDPCHPKTAYGIYKYAGELLCQLWSRQTGSTANIVRPSAVYGPLDMPGRVIERFFYNAMHNIPLKVQGADEVLDFTYLNDIGDCLIAASQYHHNDVFNGTFGRGWTLGEAAEIIVTLVGKGELDIQARDNSYPKRGALNTNNARAKLNFEPYYDLNTGLATYYEHLRTN